MTPFYYDEPDTVSGEPIRGLPEPLPKDESILWQGQPSAWRLAMHAYHLRAIAIYLVAMIVWRMAAQASAGATSADLVGIAVSGVALGLVGLAIMMTIAWATARTAIFTLTQKRIVMRYGVAIRKYVNLPLDQIAAADLRMIGKDHGDIALTATGRGVGYIYLWPFARPMKLVPAYPSLRALPEADAVARKIADAFAAHKGKTAAAPPSAAPQPASPATAVTAGDLPANIQPA